MRKLGSLIVLPVVVLMSACGAGEPSPGSPSTSGPATATTQPPDPFSVTWSRVEAQAGLAGDGIEMFGVTAGGPGFVAVGLDWSGGGEAVWTSPDGLAWTRVSYDDPAFGWMLDVTAGGPGVVAVGLDRSTDDVDALVWTSPDGVNWTKIDDAVLGGEGDQVMWSVTAGGPGLVAVGTHEVDDVGMGIEAGESSDAAVWVSSDGIFWTRVEDEATLGGDGSQQMFGVAAGGPGLVAVGRADDQAAVWTSPNGTSWTRVADQESFGGSVQMMASVAAGGPGLVAVGFADASAAVWTSADGSSWTRVEDQAAFGGDGGRQMMSVAAGGPGLVAVGMDLSGQGEDAAIWTSSDGIAWSRIIDESVSVVEGRQWMNAVAADASGVVAVGLNQPEGEQGPPVAAVWFGAKGE